MECGVGDGIDPGTIARTDGAGGDGTMCIGGIVDEFGIYGCVRLHGEVPLCVVPWLFREIGPCGWFGVVVEVWS